MGTAILIAILVTCAAIVAYLLFKGDGDGGDSGGPSASTDPGDPDEPSAVPSDDTTDTFVVELHAAQSGAAALKKQAALMLAAADNRPELSSEAELEEWKKDTASYGFAQALILVNDAASNVGYWLGTSDSLSEKGVEKTRVQYRSFTDALADLNSIIKSAPDRDFSLAAMPYVAKIEAAAGSLDSALTHLEDHYA